MNFEYIFQGIKKPMMLLHPSLVRYLNEDLIQVVQLKPKSILLPYFCIIFGSVTPVQCTE